MLDQAISYYYFEMYSSLHSNFTIQISGNSSEYLKNQNSKGKCNIATRVKCDRNTYIIYIYIYIYVYIYTMFI